MGMSERAVHINNLVALKDFCNNNGVFTLASNIEQSLDYAISSIKTDEAYQIMYEGGEIFTKDEVIAMFTELQLEIEELDSRAGYSGDGMPTFSTDYIRKKKVNEIIQQKINSFSN